MLTSVSAQSCLILLVKFYSIGRNRYYLLGAIVIFIFHMRTGMPDQVTEQVELGFELDSPTLRTVLNSPQLWRTACSKSISSRKSAKLHTMKLTAKLE